MDYYIGNSSMSGYGLGNRLAKLFRSALSIAKKYIANDAADCASSTMNDWGPGKDFQESISQNPKLYVRSLGVWLKSQQTKKGLYRRETTYIISLNSG